MQQIDRLAAAADEHRCSTALTGGFGRGGRSVINGRLSGAGDVLTLFTSSADAKKMVSIDASTYRGSSELTLLPKRGGCLGERGFGAYDFVGAKHLVR